MSEHHQENFHPFPKFAFDLFIFHSNFYSVFCIIDPQLDDADGVTVRISSLPGVCSSHEDVTLVHSSVSRRHFLQDQRHVSVLHLSVLQIHSVVKIRALIEWIKRVIVVKKDVFWLQISSAPLYTDDVVVWSSTWQNDRLSRLRCDDSLV